LLWRCIAASPAERIKRRILISHVSAGNRTLQLLPATYGLRTNRLVHGKNNKLTSSFLLMLINCAVSFSVTFHYFVHVYQTTGHSL